jgi:hypothetical protein
LFIFSDERKFREKFSALENALGIVISSSSSLPSDASRKLSSFLIENNCDLMSRISQYSDDISNQVEAFFEYVSARDKEKLFSYQSKVILSMEKYAEIQQIFLINNYKKRHRSSNLIVFCDDPEIFNLLNDIFLNKKIFRLELPSIYAWSRFIRTLLRVCFLSQPKTQVKRVVLTLSKSFPSENVDTYFGVLPKRLTNDGSTITICICAGKEILFSKRPGLIPIESFLNITDVLGAWYQTMVQSFLASFQTANSRKNRFFFKLSKFIKNKEIRSGNLFYNSYLLASFRGLFVTLNPSSLIYPFENRSWEKQLLLCAHSFDCKDTIGYQHSSVTPRHLSLKIPKHKFSTKEVPNKIITVGRITFDWLKKNSPPISDRLIIGGSLRKIQKRLPLPKSKGILVPISSSLYEAQRMLLIMNEVAKKTNIPITIRSHPTIDCEALYRSMIWHKNVSLSRGRNLCQDILRSHVIIYSSSTVVIEGMLSGRLPIFLDIRDYPSGDPLLGNSKYTASSAKEVRSVLNLIDDLSQEELKKKQLDAMKFADDYLKDITVDKFLTLL